MSSSVVLLDKKTGLTSFSSLGVLKRALGRKCGHAGTLDKFASGLLIAFSGRFTRLNDVFMGLGKVYDAVFEFGKETDTLDPEGEAILKAPLPSLEAIMKALNSFGKNYSQTPPAFSAVHVNGTRAYKLARSGNEVPIAAKEVRLESFEVKDWNPPFLSIKLEVSKGFYVRSFARDLAKRAGSCAYVSSLRRTQIGPYRVEDAVSCDDLEEIQRSSSVFDPIEFLSRLSGVQRIELTDKGKELISHGVIPSSSMEEVDDQSSLILFCHEGRLCSITDAKGRFICQAETE